LNATGAHKPAQRAAARGPSRRSLHIPGAGCARGRGFDVEEYAERIYRANIKLGLAEVPRDYFKPRRHPTLKLTEENSFKGGANRL
jgi:hypothetical protein